MISESTIKKLQNLETPFYYYDVNLLRDTLQLVKQESDKYGFIIHYALKANSNIRIINLIKDFGFGADCVSGNEVILAHKLGIPSDLIVYAGVGKADKEIYAALDRDIFCFNCESLQEIEVINQLAGEKNKVVNIAIRINPNVNAQTHKYITTGLEENKFGINPWEFDNVLTTISKMQHIKLTGIHFHIGSQIEDLQPFKRLCNRVNELQEWFRKQKGIEITDINVGGGLGIDYSNPDTHNIPDFKTFFKIFDDLLELYPNQKLHFELGRSIIGQCAYLISRVLYVKQGINTKFAIIDAGMTELIRPALYQAYHKINNLTSKGKIEKYDVVGPICESSDTFGKAHQLPHTQRGDLIAVRSVGAYGETMASQYNLRDIAKSYFSDEF